MMAKRWLGAVVGWLFGVAELKAVAVWVTGGSGWWWVV
jgi:hypothetical protein